MYFIRKKERGSMKCTYLRSFLALRVCLAIRASERLEVKVGSGVAGKSRGLTSRAGLGGGQAEPL